MKNPQNNSLNRNFTSKKQCSSCGLLSNDVNKSVKYNKNLCIYCLKEIIVDSHDLFKDTDQ